MNFLFFIRLGDPQSWTSEQVNSWLRYQINKLGLAESVCSSLTTNFLHVDGKDLFNMTLDNFVDVCASKEIGELLYQAYQSLIRGLFIFLISRALLFFFCVDFPRIE